MQRTDTYEIPMEAIREALLNAIVHRDYANAGRDIKVGIYDDIVNIVSPGGLPNTLTGKDILYGRSEVRNRVVARVFKELNYIEQWGTGIRRIKSSCLQYGLKEPQIKETGDFVDVELYREIQYDESTISDTDGKVSDSIGKVPDNTKKLSDQEIRISEWLKKNKSIVTKDVESLLSVKEARARRILKVMTEKKIIDRKGKGRNTYYVAVEPVLLEATGYLSKQV